MNTIYHTNRMTLQILHPGQENMILDFYEQNKDFLEPFEPTRMENFYTIEYQRSNLACEYNAFAKFNYMRYWLFLSENPSLPLGSVSFSNFRKGAFSSCIVGYKLAEKACRHGYMYEALSFLVPEVARDCHIRRIEAMVLPDNPASIRLLERLGFTKEGYLHTFAQINGQWKDHILYTYLGNNETSLYL